jgi:ATP-dependent DNA helicase UvrD/PcrA
MLPKGLTPEQQAAVTHGPGPLLIFAGPGSGKTLTLTQRIAHLIRTRAAAAAEVLAVTFTVRATAEMRLRLIDLLGKDAVDGLTVRTFHSVCARLVREHARTFDRSEQFTIYDETEMKQLIEGCLRDSRACDGRAHLAAGEVRREISQAKSRLLDIDAYEMLSEHPACSAIAAVWHEVNLELKASNAVDFDDLVVLAARLLRERPAVADRLRTRWRYVLVDEYQDTNVAQAEWLRLLTGPDGNVACVGDDDQALYGWRAAEVDNILAFDRLYPHHRTVTLAANFRSRPEIVASARRCIDHNLARQPKQLEAVRGAGGSAQLARFASDADEAEWVANTIAWFLEHGVAPDEILVMMRSTGPRGRLFRPLEEQLVARQIPHRLVGTLGLYERREVRAALAYLALLANPHDAAAFSRAIAFPSRRCGERSTAAIVSFARENYMDLLSACALASSIRSAGVQRARAAIAQFGNEMLDLRRQLATRSLAHVATAMLMMADGPVRHLQAVRDDAEQKDEREAAERVLEDLRSLLRAIGGFEREAEDPTPACFVAEAAGLDQAEVDAGDEPSIMLSTVHMAKGLEAKVCFLLGCEESRMPAWRALQQQPPALDEERRVFYVAMTRARDRLYLCWSARRGGRDSDELSRFVREALARPHH